MSSPAPRLLAAIDAHGHGLRVLFTQVGDRWQHIVETISGESSTQSLASIEGGTADAWPPSPPLQSLSLETLPDGREVAFLVGMSGTSHWSASIEAVNNPPQLVFDIACRHSQPPAELGSSYQSLDASLTISADRPDSTVTTSADQVRITPPLASAAGPRTTQWKYRVQLAK